MSKDLIAKGAADEGVIVQSPFPQRSMTTAETLPSSVTPIVTSNKTVTPEPIASMSEKIPIVSSKEESQPKSIGTATPASSASSSVRSPNDASPPITKQAAKKTEEKPAKGGRRDTVSTWVPWDEPTTNTDRKMQRTMSVASSKPIPDLRSYLERSHTVTGSAQPKSTALRRSATNTPTSTTPRSSKTPVITSNRASLPPTTRATITPTTRTTTTSVSRAASTTAKGSVATSRASKTPGTVTRASKTPLTSSTRASRTPSSTASSSPSSASPPLSRAQSTYRPALTATVRARQEHAKAKEKELEEQKLKASQLNGVNLRLKQQARSSIDWAAIKQERRRTMPIIKPSSS
ncbi:hypothetical protein BDC45DRAFT_102061 [Circinella umbellata]|nr:hypothetical protein BDC45DRAFT_102061 [Circinella umbellata]